MSRRQRIEDIIGLRDALNATPTGSGGAVSSVFGRTGAVAATAGDYTAAQVGAVGTSDSRLSDARTPTAHKTSHQLAGSDALNVAGLSGVLADPQPPIIGATVTTAVAGNDARLTDARTPLAHTHTHASTTGQTANDHHNQAHVLATNAALGADHTVSGAAAGQVLRASSATAANFQALVAGDLPSLPESQITNLTTDLAAKEVLASKDAVSGYAGLDAGSKIKAAAFPALTGDITTAGGALATTLAAAGTAGTYRSVTTDAKGRVTAGTNPTTIAGYGLTDAEPKRLQARMTADQTPAIGVAATALTSLTLALAAATHYRFHAVIMYVCTVTTATLAARAVHSGTLGTNASGESLFKVYGSSGVPTVWAAVAKETTQIVSAAIITATGGPGAAGSASVAMLEIEGDVFTGTAGNLTIEIVSSVALGITPQADSHVEAWIVA